MCLLIKEYITTSELAKGVQPESDQASGPSCQYAGNMEGRGNGQLHHECTISKTQTVGIFTGQMPQVLQ